MTGLWFEDLHERRVIDAGWRRTVSESDRAMACDMTMNMQPRRRPTEDAA